MNSFEQFTVNNRVAGFKPQGVPLKSGRISKWYVNWRPFTGDVYWTREIVKYVLDFAREQGLNPTCFYGVPEGMSLFGGILEYSLGINDPNLAPGSHPLVIGRGRPKDHGNPRDRFFAGGALRGKTVVVEDVTTTSQSLLGALCYVRQLEEPEIIAAIGLTNRMELTPIPGRDKPEVVDQFAEVYKHALGRDYRTPMSVADLLGEAGVPYYAMGEATNILPALYEMEQPGEEVARAVEREFEEHGCIPLRLL